MPVSSSCVSPSPLSALPSPPPQEVGRALRQWEQTREDMSHSAESLKTTLSEPNRRRVELKLAEMSERWSELNVVVLKRIAETRPMLKEVESFWEAAGVFERWLEEQEGRMVECGSIGTDEGRLVEQAKILDVSVQVYMCMCNHLQAPCLLNLYTS